MTSLMSISDFLFDKSFYSFNRPVFDMHPYHTELYDDKTVIIHNVLGINEEDIKVEIKKEGPNHYLYITIRFNCYLIILHFFMKIFKNKL